MANDPKKRVDTASQPQRIYPLQNPYSQQHKNIKGLIFDMDGTVIDSNKHGFDAWTKAFEPFEVTFKYEDYVKELGAKGEEIVKKHVVVSDEEASKIVENKNKFFKENVETKGLESMQFIQPILDQAREMELKLALATGSKRDKLNLIFKHVDLRHYFDDIITADEVNNGKPDPEIFLKAAEKLGLEPGEIIVWEDAELGVKAAKNAHMKCVCITTTQMGDRHGLEEADLIIDTYKNIDLQDLINKIS